MADYIITRENSDNHQELQHYGVIGMKWGIRHDPVKAYSKAIAKQTKLDTKVSKTRDKYLKRTAKANRGVSIRYQKKQAKADKKQAKADRKKYGLFTNSTKAAKLQVKADRAQYKANKYKSRYEKRNAKADKATGKYQRAQRKAERWTRQMNKTFKDYNISQLSPEHVASGQAYIRNKL